jgi:hypothetical protein
MHPPAFARSQCNILMCRERPHGSFIDRMDCTSTWIHLELQIALSYRIAQMTCLASPGIHLIEFIQAVLSMSHAQSFSRVSGSLAHAPMRDGLRV